MITLLILVTLFVTVPIQQLAPPGTQPTRVAPVMVGVLDGDQPQEEALPVLFVIAARYAITTATAAILVESGSVYTAKAFTHTAAWAGPGYPSCTWPSAIFKTTHDTDHCCSPFEDTADAACMVSAGSVSQAAAEVSAKMYLELLAEDFQGVGSGTGCKTVAAWVDTLFTRHVVKSAPSASETVTGELVFTLDIGAANVSLPIGQLATQMQYDIGTDTFGPIFSGGFALSADGAVFAGDLDESFYTVIKNEEGIVVAGDPPPFEIVVPVELVGDEPLEFQQEGHAAGVHTTDDALPVDLVSFTAVRDFHVVDITWETAAEIDVVGFRLWRSEEQEGEYTHVGRGFITAAGTPSQGATYSATDAGFPPEARRLFYRLEEIDADGTSTMSNPIMAIQRRSTWYSRNRGMDG